MTPAPEHVLSKRTVTGACKQARSHVLMLTQPPEQETWPVCGEQGAPTPGWLDPSLTMPTDSSPNLSENPHFICEMGQ